MRKHRNVALDTALGLIGHRVLTGPLAFALLALELAIALLSSLVWSQLIVGRIEPLNYGDI